MPYITEEEIWERGGVSKTALQNRPASELDGAIAGASDTIDSYLRVKFTLPLTAYGDDIKRCAARIAAYDLISGGGFDPNEPGDDNLRDRYEDAMRWLKGIAAGTVIPKVTDSAPAGAAVGRARVTSSSQRGWSTRGTGQRRGPFQTD